MDLRFLVWSAQPRLRGLQCRAGAGTKVSCAGAGTKAFRAGAS